MLDATRVLAGISGVLLLTAVAAWLKLGRTPLFRRIDGRSQLDSASGEVAAKLLVAALVGSLLAAFLAVIGSILN